MKPLPKWASLLRSWKVHLLVVLVAAPVLLLTDSCGGSGGSQAVEQQAISGKVVDGFTAAAVVCIDLNESGRCDGDEAQARTDAAGAWQLSVPRGTPAPLVAEIVAGQSRDPVSGAVANVSYRMASPSVAYGTTISPFSTLVLLCREKDLAIAEALVRNVVGLPPYFDLAADYTARDGSLGQAVSRSVATALKASGGALELPAQEGMKSVMAKLPEAVTTLPTLAIATKNGAPILDRENYVDATYTLANPAVPGQVATLNGKIRGRGHSTWGLPKNPYKVQFKEDAAWASLPDVLGMRKNRNWALLADYNDRTLMRNKLAFALAGSSAFSGGLKWTPTGQHVEVSLNGDYVGVYLLTEDIRIDPARLDIHKMSKSPTLEEVDGGYIVEVDVRLDCYNVGAMNLQHRTPRGVPVCVDKPDEGDITLPQLSWIKTYLDGVEGQIYDLGRLDGINAASFADWYLLSELFRNNDAVFFSSVFLWKDAAGATQPSARLLNLGPLWDFDLSAGNVNVYENWRTEGCWVAKSLAYQPSWLTKLFGYPEFVSLTLERWKAKRPAIEAFVNASIDIYAWRLDAAQQRNFARWPLFGTQGTGYFTFGSYAEEVAFLKRFLNERMAWLDAAYASPESFRANCLGDGIIPN